MVSLEEAKATCILDSYQFLRGVEDGLGEELYHCWHWSDANYGGEWSEAYRIFQEALDSKDYDRISTAGGIFKKTITTLSYAYERKRCAEDPMAFIQFIERKFGNAERH